MVKTRSQARTEDKNVFEGVPKRKPMLVPVVKLKKLSTKELEYIIEKAAVMVSSPVRRQLLGNKHDFQQSAKKADDCGACNVPRLLGCMHPCQRRYHESTCDKCTVTTKMACHCGLTEVHVKCGELNRHGVEDAELKENRENQLSCDNRSIKNYDCGHRCTSTCHSGECSNPESCRKELEVYCDCKNHKVETSCDKIRDGFTLPCDDACTEKRLIEEKNAVDADLAELDIQMNLLEIGKFETKLGKKKRMQVAKDTSKRKTHYRAAIINAMLAAFIFYLLASIPYHTDCL